MGKHSSSKQGSSSGSADRHAFSDAGASTATKTKKKQFAVNQPAIVVNVDLTVPAGSIGPRQTAYPLNRYS
jgi:hypothetical protein